MRKGDFYVQNVGQAHKGQPSAKGYNCQSRTQMVFDCLDEICYEFDLEKPIWLDSNIKDFKLHAKTRFGRDHFIESVDFDYLEIQVIEE